MTTAASSAQTDIVFRGIDGKECETFIAAIQQTAYDEGWSRDNERMLLFARSRLRDQALRWFVKLDAPQQNEWRLFLDALFDQYPSVPSEPEPEPDTLATSTRVYSPSIATTMLPEYQPVDPRPEADDDRRTTRNEITRSFPVSQYTRLNIPSSTVRRLGTLRLVVEDDVDAPQYIWRGPEPTISTNTKGMMTVTHNEYLSTTMNRQEALVVCFIPFASPFQIGCLNARSNLRDLAIDWPFFHGGRYQLRLFDGVVPVPQKPGSSVKVVSQVWNIRMDGALEASVYEYVSIGEGRARYTKKEAFKTTQVHVDTSGSSILFVRPGTLLWQDDPSHASEIRRYEFKARIVFESL